MHVMIVSRGIPSKELPMSGIFEWDQAKALNKAGIKVTFLVADFRSVRHFRSYSTKFFTRDGINIVYGNFPLGNLPANIFYNIGKWKLWQITNLAIKKYGYPNIFHAHFTEIGAISTFVANKYGIPCIITEHSSALNLDILSPKTKYWGNIAYNKSKGLIAVSERLRQRILTNFRINSTVIPNMVDINSIKFNSHSFNYSNKHKKVLFVSTGNLLTRKGHDILVSSFAKLPSHLAELIIIGNGPEKDNLNRLIKRVGAEDRIHLVGYKSREDISKIYEKADCFVLVSRRETFGVVYIEAMLAGLPVIATRCGGPEDFVNENNGILVDVDNELQLTNALLEMIEKSVSYSKNKIHEETISKFNPDVISHKIIDKYNEIENEYYELQ